MAVTNLTIGSAGAINYTVVTDSSADWASVSNSTYFYDKTDKLVHYKDSTGTVQEIFSGSGVTVGTTAVTSGTDGRVFFQAGGVVQQDANFTFDNTLKRLTLKAVGTAVTDVPFIVQNSALTASPLYVRGTGTVEMNPTNSGAGTLVKFTYDANGASNVTYGTPSGLVWHNFYTPYVYSSLDGNNGYEGRIDLGRYNGAVRTRLACTGDSFFQFSNLVIGAQTAGARLDVRAQGALSTDIAFRVRNSADTFNLLSIDGVGLISGRTDGAGGFSMNYQGTANTTVQLGFQNTNPYLRVANSNAGGHAFNVYTSSDNREYLAGLIGKATLAIGANPFGGTIKPNEANTNTLYMFNGTAPTLSATDSFNLYSADITAGNAAPHFRTENGAIVKVYQETTAVAAATLVGNAGTNITDTDTFDGYTLKQIVKALRNQGLLA